MSLVLYGGGVADMRGSIGGTTFSRSRAGATARNKTSPVNIKNNFTTIVRGRLATWSQSWQHDLTEIQRMAWNGYALATPTTNVFGATVFLSGQQWYVRCNINVNLVNGVQRVIPPPAGAWQAPLMVTVAATALPGGSIVITGVQPGTLPASGILFYASPGLSKGVSYANARFRYLGFGDANASPWDITTLYQTRFGSVPLLSGQKLFVKVCNMHPTSGLKSYTIIADTIVP